MSIAGGCDLRVKQPHSSHSGQHDHKPNIARTGRQRSEPSCLPCGGQPGHRGGADDRHKLRSTLIDVANDWNDHLSNDEADRYKRLKPDPPEEAGDGKEIREAGPVSNESAEPTSLEGEQHGHRNQQGAHTICLMKAFCENASTGQTRPSSPMFTKGTWTASRRDEANRRPPMLSPRFQACGLVRFCFS